MNKKTDEWDISKIMRELRNRQQKTLEGVAEELDVSRQTISNWESGKSTPDAVSMMKFMRAYDPSLEEFRKLTLSTDSDEPQGEIVRMFPIFCKYICKGLRPAFEEYIRKDCERQGFNRLKIAPFIYEEFYDNYICCNYSLVLNAQNETFNELKESIKSETVMTEYGELRLDAEIGRSWPNKIRPWKVHASQAPRDSLFVSYDELQVMTAAITMAAKKSGYIVTWYPGFGSFLFFDSSPERLVDAMEKIMYWLLVPSECFKVLDYAERQIFSEFAKKMAEIHKEYNVRSKDLLKAERDGIERMILDEGLAPGDESYELLCVDADGDNPCKKLPETASLDGLLEIIEVIGMDALDKMHAKQDGDRYVIVRRGADADESEGFREEERNGFKYRYVELRQERKDTHSPKAEGFKTFHASIVLSRLAERRSGGYWDE